ncbi:MAG: zeta toxin family protein, partial [Silvanigrellaceae bacterium]|nr:zeta toxin family protein [Silvanigrellaceae bacterium]
YFWPLCRCSSFAKIQLLIGILNLNQTTSLVPESLVKELLQPYTKQEQKAIKEDLQNIRSLIFTHLKKAPGERVYVATAGGPGASKSTILESYLAHLPYGKSFAYIDPDQRGLKFMINTYVSDINNYAYSMNPHDNALLKEKYNKWRNASNYIANTLLNEAFKKKYAIAHGTTSSSPFMKDFYQTLKKKGYKITLLLCASSYENRLNAIKHREDVQKFVQATPEDVMNKVNLFYKNFPVYFDFADEIHMFWTDKFSEGSKEVALFAKNSKIKILDESDFEKFKNSYETFRSQQTNTSLPSFNEITHTHH